MAEYPNIIPENISPSQPNSCPFPRPIPPQMTWEGAFADAKSQAFAGGYGLRKSKKQARRYWFRCEFSGLPDKKGFNPDTHESKRRKGGRSKKTGCAFGYVCTHRKDDGLWHTSLMKADDGTGYHRHNHDRSDPKSLTSHRSGAITDEVMEFIVSQIALGIAPRNIVAAAETLFTPKYQFTVNAKDVSNIRQKWKATGKNPSHVDNTTSGEIGTTVEVGDETSKREEQQSPKQHGFLVISPKPKKTANCLD